ncbi:MAG: hypothetical protein BGO67_12245 [Alphaproteobacteria bacterium 41-28]|nr:MAG: hypothetical protein BGO67_12245 [Alphaproteobacteria bacterium 41-28]
MKKILLCTALLLSCATLAHAMQEEMATEEKGSSVTYTKPDENKLKAFIAENIEDGIKTGRLTYNDENGTWELSRIHGQYNNQYWQEKMVAGPLGQTVLSLKLYICPFPPRDKIHHKWDFEAWDKKIFQAGVADGGVNFITFMINKQD